MKLCLGWQAFVAEEGNATVGLRAVHPTASPCQVDRDQDSPRSQRGPGLVPNGSFRKSGALT